MFVETLMKSVFLLCVCLLMATTAFGEGTLGWDYSRAVDDQSWGAHGDYEQNFGPFDVELEGQIQSGDVYKGDIGFAVTFPAVIIPIDLQLASNNDLKGYSLDGLGRVNKLSAAFVVPVKDVDVFVGVFGRNGNPFANPNLFDVGLNNGFVEDDLVAIGAADIFPLDRGITMPEGSAAGVSLEAEFDVSRFEISAKGLGELWGEGTRVHQARFEVTTGGDLIDDRIRGLFGDRVGDVLSGFGWSIVANVAVQAYDGLIEHETGIRSGIEYKW